MFQFPSNGKARVNEIRAQLRQIWAKSFNSLQTGRHVWTDFLETNNHNTLVSIPFKREGTCELAKKDKGLNGVEKFQFPSNGKARVNHQTKETKGTTKYRFNSLQTGRHVWTAPILHPVGPWLRTPKTKRELREAFFAQKFGAKVQQTLVNTDPNAMFRHKRLGSQTPSAFLGNFHRIRTQSANRVCVYKYILNLHKCQTFLYFFTKKWTKQVIIGKDKDIAMNKVLFSTFISCRLSDDFIYSLRNFQNISISMTPWPFPW